jgi:hypothetical protein
MMIAVASLTSGARTSNGEISRIVTLPVSALATASIAALASAIVFGEGVCAISKTV